MSAIGSEAGGLECRSSFALSTGHLPRPRPPLSSPTMDSESPLSPREPETRPPRKATKRGPRNGVRIGALIALAVAGGLVAWVLVDRSDDEDAAQGTTATATTSLPSTPSETVTQPAIRTIAELRAMAAASSTPIYWAGARADTRLEVSETSSGTVFVRYLPAGSGAGDLDPHLTVATYARPNGYAEVQAAAKNEGSQGIELEGGGLAVYDAKAPTNVHLAFPGETYQVEVFSPEGALALRLVSNGKIQPVPAPAP